MILLLYYCIYMIYMTRQNPSERRVMENARVLIHVGIVRVVAVAVNRCTRVGDMYALINWLATGVDHIPKFRLHVAGLTCLLIRST